MVACRNLGPPPSESSRRSPDVRFSATSGALSRGDLVAGGLMLSWGFAGGALCGISVAVALLGCQLVKEKLERGKVYG